MGVPFIAVWEEFRLRSVGSPFLRRSVAVGLRTEGKGHHVSGAVIFKPMI
jgi:hypothetical protein